jgi:hypothetical protein
MSGVEHKFAQTLNTRVFKSQRADNSTPRVQCFDAVS